MTKLTFETALILVLSQRVLLLHGNRRPHTARPTRNLSDSWLWEILPHPPYSPDLAPSEFHLIPKLRKRQQLASSSFYYQSLDSLNYQYENYSN
ncbi:hypothetical protein AVEN_212460-1 [Araneus ventricosus]|uniref:Histone-lysine N-methyltransferase SETMAR n=1 Tax=Araneus ventricosus TaxID=182803 RepID=A0A4Y2JCA2_ARAVE|nr:hypothetical protein AVEN_212460-1 [Araneus ventricosus]